MADSFLRDVRSITGQTPSTSGGILFDHTGESIPLGGDREPFYVSIFAGPETVVTVGGSATRKMLSILAPSGEARLTYEQALALKDWLNDNVG